MRSFPLLVALALGPSVIAQPLVSSGGRVLGSPRVVVVLWGETVGSSLPAEVQTFYEMAASLGHWTWLSQYDTPFQHIGHPTYIGTFQIVPRTTRTRLRDRDIATELRGQIDAGNLPPTTLDTYYAVYVPEEIGIDDFEGGTLCKKDSGAAYHGDLGRGPDAGTFGIFPTCARNASLALHELVEAATDPYGNGWRTVDGAEIADLCEGYGTSLLLPDGGTMSLQQLWSNRLNSCAASGDEFRIALSPNSAPPGATVQFELSAVGPGVSPDQVSWTINGLGDGNTYEIAPPTAGSGGTLTLHLTPPYPWIFFIEARTERFTASAAPRLTIPSTDAPNEAPVPTVAQPSPPAPPAGCSQTGGPSLPLLVLAVAAFPWTSRWSRVRVEARLPSRAARRRVSSGMLLRSSPPWRRGATARCSASRSPMTRAKAIL